MMCIKIKYEAVPMKQIQHTALRKKVSCYHYLIKSSDNLKPFLQLFKEMDVCQYGNVR